MSKTAERYEDLVMNEVKEKEEEMEEEMEEYREDLEKLYKKFGL